jgi:hypothetical protein
MDTNLTTLAAVAGVTSEIDELYILDQEAKRLADRIKLLKANIANKYGEGEHKGETHGVSIQLVQVSGTVDYAKLCEAHGITEEVLNQYRKAGRADIRVSPKK